MEGSSSRQVGGTVNAVRVALLRSTGRSRTSDNKRLALRGPRPLRRTRRVHAEAGEVVVVSKVIARLRLWRGGSPTWKRQAP